MRFGLGGTERRLTKAGSTFLFAPSFRAFRFGVLLRVPTMKLISEATCSKMFRRRAVGFPFQFTSFRVRKTSSFSVLSAALAASSFKETLAGAAGPGRIPVSSRSSRAR